MDRDILAALRDIARANAQSAPARNDMCGPQWAALAEKLDAHLADQVVEVVVEKAPDEKPPKFTPPTRREREPTG